jgi:serine/threonine protein kinase
VPIFRLFHNDNCEKGNRRLEGTQVADINHDLLLAVLTLRTGSATGDALRSVLTEWSQNPDRSLSALLRDRGILDGGHLETLQRLVSAHLDDHNGDIRASLDACNAHALTQDLLTEIASTAPGTTLGGSLTRDAEPTVGDLHGLDSKSREGRDAPSFSSEDRFERIRPHAKGGIGQVWMARDRELQRMVALKEIQPQFAERDDQRARFLLEAEITGSLEHPGIVPVYSLGRDTDGRPYYAMRFIHGESLAVAIKHFHRHRLAAPTKASRRGGSTWGVEFQQLLRRFLDVCDAMEYAHSRGVIHRDLKPGNIMLGPFGETLVVDWGIAKVIDNRHTAPGGDGPGEADDLDPEFTLSSTATSGETQPGTTIGTPSYMSPEQARGALEEIGPASDVYSLGATLYELLTGTSPYQGEKALKIIAKVKEGQLIPPRSLLATIPPALEAICLKAMALKPESRYESARELALDLEHWLADEPVSAYAETRIQKLSRWLRRHRAWTPAAAVALVGITMVATIAVFVVEGSRRSEAEAHKEAETNFNMAQEAVEEYLTNVSENTLLKEQDSLDIRTLRQELLTTALRYYKKFVSQRSDDPRLREKLAGAYFRVGEITQVVGPAREALSAFQSAVEIWEPLVATSPDHLEFKARLADSYVAISKLKKIDHLQEALNWLELSRQIREDLTFQKPLDAGFSASLAECYSEIGDCNAMLGQTSKALEFLQMARGRQEKLVTRFPNQTGYKKSLAAIINLIGYVYYQRKDYPAALRTYREFQRLCLELLEQVNDGPKPLDIQNLLAYSYFNIALIYMAQGETQSALDSYDEARKQWSRMVETHPSVRKFQADLGTVYVVMGSLLHQVNHDEEAFSLLRKSLEVFQRLEKSEPENVGPHIELGRTWNAIGYLHDELRQNAQAIDDFRNALDEHRFVLLHSQDQDEIKKALCLVLSNLGEQFVDLGRVNEGLQNYLEAVGVRRELVTAHADSLDDALALVKLLGTIGDIKRLDGKFADAMKLYQEARVIVEGWQEKAPPGASLRAKVTEYTDREAKTLMDLNSLEEARTLLERDAKSRSSQDPTPGGTGDRESVSEALWDHARIARIGKNKKEADRLDHQRESLWDREPVDKLVAFAATLASRADMIGYGLTALSAAGQRVRELDHEQAAAALRLALGRGFSDVDKIIKNRSFGPLLKRDDIKILLFDRAFPSSPFGEPR